MRTSKICETMFEKNPVEKTRIKSKGPALFPSMFSLSKRRYLVGGFNPIWKIWVKLGSSSPIFGVKLKQNWVATTKIELPPPSDPIPNLLSCFFGFRTSSKHEVKSSSCTLTPGLSGSRETGPKNSHTSCVPCLCAEVGGTESNQNVPKINIWKISPSKHLHPQQKTIWHTLWTCATKCPKIPCHASPAAFSTPRESQSINDKKLPCNVAVLQSYHFKIVGFLGGWESPSSWLISLLFNQPSEST